MFLFEVVTDVSKGQEVVILWNPAVLLYNSFLVGGKNGDYVGKGNHAQKAQGHWPQETHSGVLAQSQPLPASILLWCLQFTKSLLSEIINLSVCLLNA